MSVAFYKLELIHRNMKLKSYIVSALVIGLSITGCKDAASKPQDRISNESTKKEVAAVKPETASFKIEGMVCPDGCAKMIEKKISGIEGVQTVKVDYQTKTATVNFDLDKLTSDDLTKAVESCADGKTYKVSDFKTGKKV